jgi:hypothetical protein
MANFQTEIPNLEILGVFQLEDVGIFFGHWVFCIAIVSPIWYVVQRTIWQPWAEVDFAKE